MRACDVPGCGREKVLVDVGLLAGPVEVCPKCDLGPKKILERRDRLLSCLWPELRRARLLPFLHQFDGVARIVSGDPYLLIGDEMGVAKSKQVIDAAQILYERGQLTQVIVVAPATVRPVWYEPDYGEVSKHTWTALPVGVTEFHRKSRYWTRATREDRRALSWLITNYDFIRNKDRLDTLLHQCDKKTLLVLDESSAVKNPSAAQTKSCMALRKMCGRVILLNGTPISEGPGDAFSQGNILHPSILNCPSKTQFRARYAVMEAVRGAGGRALTDPYGRPIQQVVGWRNQDDLTQRFAPHVIRRLKSECLDLPPKLPSIVLPVALHASWPAYKEMREECLAWVGEGDASLSPQAATKILRLTQITSGFLGGVEHLDFESRTADLGALFSEEAAQDAAQDHLLLRRQDAARTRDSVLEVSSLPLIHKEEVDVGREKLDFFLSWLAERIEEERAFKLLVWSRHRHEILRTVAALREIVGLHVGVIIGQQTEAEREAAKRLLMPETTPDGPCVVVGHPASGGKGLTLVAASAVLYMSNEWSLEKRLQSEDRVHRPGQTRAVSYFDLVATGPRGQRTVDHDIVMALARKDDLANATMSQWRQIIQGAAA